MHALKVNGRDYFVDTPDSTPLLAVLRDELALSGPRFGCGQGECGACMVLVDGRAQTACNLPIDALSGCAVETVEGLGTPSDPHPLQAAVLAERAGQCGYCLSGILISAAALLRAHPSPSRDQIVAALEPHLCRCGAHQRIVRAIERAARALNGTTP